MPTSEGNKRRFRNTSEQVVCAVEACLRNSVELGRAASEQLAANRPGLAVALTVLALEEIGKLLITDGLAFARPGDERAKKFEDALRSHRTKLEVLDLFPFAVPYFAQFDRRYATEERFTQAIAISLYHTKSSRDELQKWLGDNWSFQDLDRWKQKGFYAHLSNGVTLMAPNDAIDQEFAETLVKFGNVLINFVDFPLRNSFDRYREMLDSVRSSWSEAEYIKLQERVQNGLKEFFGGSASEDGGHNRG